jgi:membrane protein DedA with SNARE-associated domain
VIGTPVVPLVDVKACAVVHLDRTLVLVGGAIAAFAGDQVGYLFGARICRRTVYET